MKLFTLKYLFLTTVFVLFGCLSIQAADVDLITEQISIKLDKAGTLPNKIESSKKYKITNLKIIGEINGTDLRMIREMAGSNYHGDSTEGKLSVLDLSEAKIVAGGDSYFDGYIGQEKYYTSNDEIGDYAFSSCSGLTSLTLPSGITKIGVGVFQYCSGLTSLTLPSGINKIGSKAFNGCSGLTSLILPAGVTEIWSYAFYGCSSLTSLEIPSSVKTIWNGAFAGCDNLTHIVCNPMVAPSCTYNIDNSDYTLKHLCEKELQDRITLITPLGASGYTTGEWSLFKKPEEIRLTDAQCSIANQGCCPIGNFSYSRTQMKSGSYATFCLPFDTNLSEVSDKFEAVYIPNQTALLNPDGKLILLLQKYDKNASLLAGQAVVVKLKSGVTDVAFSNNKLMMVDSDVMRNSEPTSLHVFDWNGNSGALLENTDVKVSFGGTLTSMTGKGSEYETFNSNGSFGPTKSGVVKAFRAYVLKENAAANSRIKSIAFGLGDDSETTGVKMISIPVENKQGDDVYTIDGRLINNTGDIEGLPSGIYIKNHQKIYVK